MPPAQPPTNYNKSGWASSHKGYLIGGGLAALVGIGYFVLHKKSSADSNMNAANTTATGSPEQTSGGQYVLPYGFDGGGGDMDGDLTGQLQTLDSQIQSMTSYLAGSQPTSVAPSTPATTAPYMPWTAPAGAGSAAGSAGSVGPGANNASGSGGGSAGGNGGVSSPQWAWWLQRANQNQALGSGVTLPNVAHEATTVAATNSPTPAQTTTSVL